jgi:AraC-like DNA-binding protein
VTDQSSLRRVHTSIRRTAPAQVSREFHRDLGLTLVEFRARLRLMRFVRLVDKGATMSTAALAAEFGSYAQFHRAFQRALGCSPRDYFRGARSAVEAATEPELSQDSAPSGPR